MTPTNCLSLVESLKFGDGENVFSKMWMDVINVMQPLVMIVINFTIIPTLIDVSIIFEDYETKSQQENARIGRNYFFMLLNILLIPVSSSTSAIVFFQNAFHQAYIYPDKWGTLLAANLMSQ